MLEVLESSVVILRQEETFLNDTIQRLVQRHKEIQNEVRRIQVVINEERRKEKEKLRQEEERRKQEQQKKQEERRRNEQRQEAERIRQEEERIEQERVMQERLRREQEGRRQEAERRRNEERIRQEEERRRRNEQRQEAERIKQEEERRRQEVERQRRGTAGIQPGIQEKISQLWAQTQTATPSPPQQRTQPRRRQPHVPPTQQISPMPQSSQTAPQRSTNREPDITCIICFDTKIGYKFKHCRHEPIICSECAAQNLDAQLRQQIFPTCPELSCKIRVIYSDLRNLCQRRLIGEHLLNIFNAIQRNEAVNAIPNQPTYTAPCATPDCSNVLSNNDPKSFCLRCQAFTCLYHKIQWHKGMSCGQFDSQNEASESWKNQNTKACPQCQVPIEKNEGCRHMTCTQCRHEFFWCCLRAYRVEEEAREHRRLCE